MRRVKHKETCRLPLTPFAVTDQSFRELHRTPRKLVTFGDDQVARQGVLHHETNKAGIRYPKTEQSSPYKKLGSPAITGNWGTARDSKKNAPRQAVKLSDAVDNNRDPLMISEGTNEARSRRYSQQVLQHLRRSLSENARSTIIRVTESFGTPSKNFRDIKKGPSRTEQIPQAIVQIGHGWEASAIKYPRCEINIEKKIPNGLNVQIRDTGGGSWGRSTGQAYGFLG